MKLSGVPFVKNTLKKTRSAVTDSKMKIEWKYSSNRKHHTCLNTQKRDARLIVSLTTFPGRIHIVYKTIITVLNQKNVKPDKVELWLAKEQFPERDKELPQNLLALTEYGLEIKWCNDLRSFKKLLPALREHPKDIIVTADDDVYYKNDWLEQLYNAYLINPNVIYCHKATKFLMTGNEFKAVGGGKEFYHEPSFLNKLVGVGGVLYPPSSVSDLIFDERKFMTLAPTNDDIWFWLMAVKNKTKISVVKNNYPKPVDLIDSYSTQKLSDINDKGEQLFWVQFQNIIKEYPDIKTILTDEWERLKK